MTAGTRRGLGVRGNDLLFLSWVEELGSLRDEQYQEGDSDNHAIWEDRETPNDR